MSVNLNVSFNEVNNMVLEKIANLKLENRVNALLHAKKELKRLEDSAAKIKMNIKEAESGNWKPLVGTFEDDINFDE